MKNEQMTSTILLFFFFLHGRGQLKRLSKSKWESPNSSFEPQLRISSRILSETLERDGEAAGSLRDASSFAWGDWDALTGSSS